MAYSITGMRRAPDVGFTAVSRQTADGARDLAKAFIADGMQEVEIRDAAGNLCDLRKLDETRQGFVPGDTMIAARLSAV